MTYRPEPDRSADNGPGGAVGEGVEGLQNVDDVETGPAEPGPVPQSGDPGQVDEAASEILTDVAAVIAERDEYLAALQRSQADFANYRKRVLRLQEEQGARAASDLITKLLPALDTLDLAIAHLDRSSTSTEDDEASEGSSESTAVKGTESVEAEALRRARDQLTDTLAKEGLERVDAVGVAFDPSVHDAVAHAETKEDDEPGMRVDEVMRPGYRWRGQTLRAAMVKVRG